MILLLFAAAPPARLENASIADILRGCKPTPRVIAELGRRATLKRREGDELHGLAPKRRLAVLRVAFDAKTRSPAVAAELAASLGKEARPLLPHLVRLMDDPDAWTRFVAAHAVILCEEPRHLDKADAVMAALAGKDDPGGSWFMPGMNPEVEAFPVSLPRTAAVLALGAWNPLNPVRRVPVSCLRQFPRDAAVAAWGLEAALDDPNPNCRWDALHALMLIGRPAKAVPVYLRLIRCGDAEERRKAIFALGWCGSAARPALPELFRILRDKADPHRAVAAQALFRMGGEDRAGERVRDLRRIGLEVLAWMDEEQGTIRHLSGVGADAAPFLPLLLRTAKRESDPERLEAAADLLGTIGQKAARAVPALRRLAEHPSESVRLVAVRALLRIAPSDRRAMNAAMREGWYWMLADTGCREAVPWLIGRLGHPNQDDSREARRALWKLDPRAAEKAGAW